jgi:hypothetical protein
MCSSGKPIVIGAGFAYNQPFVSASELAFGRLIVISIIHSSEVT